MRLIQFKSRDGERRVGVVQKDTVQTVKGVRTMRELALLAIRNGASLEGQVQAAGTAGTEDYQALLADRRVLPPLDDDPAHCFISGTGLTHLGAATTRDKMHQKVSQDESQLTDTMRIFKWGVEGGKPGQGQIGHTHNLAMAEFARDYAFCADARPTDYVAEPTTFMGIVRPDGQVATRNYIGILTSVNCSATAARAIADRFRRDIYPEMLADYPNVDGVVALTHG